MIENRRIAGLTPICRGLHKSHIVYGKTGNQLASDQYEEDWRALQAGLDLKAAGYTTLAHRYTPHISMIYPYKPDTILSAFIAEKTAEVADDLAGTSIGNLLGQVNLGNVKTNDARKQMRDQLCK